MFQRTDPVEPVREMHDKKTMAGRFAEMLEAKWMYRGQQFRLRSIIRLTVQSFVHALVERENFKPFLLHARDACL